jgi:hypothetical protein
MFPDLGKVRTSNSYFTPQFALAIVPVEEPQYRTNGLEKLLVVKRLAQESGSARSQRELTRIVALVSGDEDNRNVAARGGEVTLKLQPIHAWHLHVHDEARRIRQTAGR